MSNFNLGIGYNLLEKIRPIDEIYFITSQKYCKFLHLI
jgi:hypothetical protein